MTTLEVIVKNPSGLHARPAAQLSAFCKKYPNEITLSCGERACNPKSIFSLLHGCFKAGEQLLVSADGEGDAAAAREIADFIAALEE
ncbi:MAG: HPr family phosphocarrier protein [Lawsonibacter sp.]|nr:HPr family phosphocarrier protein [Lawsonibacter sp.]